MLPLDKILGLLRMIPGAVFFNAIMSPYFYRIIQDGNAVSLRGGMASE